MGWFWWLAFAANYTAAALFVASVLRRRSEPISMLAWIFAILTLPVVGMVAYTLLGTARIRRRAGRRRRRVASLIDRARRYAETRARQAEHDAEARLPDDIASVERLPRRLLNVPATFGNEVRVFEEANSTYYALEAAIRESRESLHLEYYIWQPDRAGIHFRDLVVQKAREGVECRVLLDAVGCWALGARFIRPMQDAGARVAFFLPINPLRRRWSINLRNHRKIAVLDGRTVFLGSQNIGDEYLGRRARLSPWRDAHLRIRGPAVLFAQQTFVEDWHFATGESLLHDRYFPTAEPSGDSIVHIVATGPDQDGGVLEQVIFAAVSVAREIIRVATPYFVPGPELRMALKHACYRGVRVQLVLPTRHDAPPVLWAGRSFYAELAQAGVEIYEYDGGVLHSKIITVDDRWCMLGSANMDVRSFRLNFEITALIYDPAVAAELIASIERDRLRSRRITRQEAWTRPLRQQLIEGAARLLSPLL